MRIPSRLSVIVLAVVIAACGGEPDLLACDCDDLEAVAESIAWLPEGAGVAEAGRLDGGPLRVAITYAVDDPIDASILLRDQLSQIAATSGSDESFRLRYSQLHIDVGTGNSSLTIVSTFGDADGGSEADAIKWLGVIVELLGTRP